MVMAVGDIRLISTVKICCNAGGNSLLGIWKVKIRLLAEISISS